VAGEQELFPENLAKYEHFAGSGGFQSVLPGARIATDIDIPMRPDSPMQMTELNLREFSTPHTVAGAWLVVVAIFIGVTAGLAWQSEIDAPAPSSVQSVPHSS
jgi:hypothetical protein